MGQPFGVGDIGLAAGDVFDVVGVDHPDAQAGVLQMGKDALPVDAGALQDDELNAPLSHVSKVMVRLIRRQSEEAVSQESNDEAILAAYRRYPNTQSMLRAAGMGTTVFDSDCATMDGFIRLMAEMGLSVEVR